MNKTMKNFSRILIVLLTVILTTSGCSGSSKGSVYWLNYKPESDEVLQEVAEMYENLTGVKVKVVTAASGTYDQMLNSELDKSHPPTIIVLGNNDKVASGEIAVSI